MMKSRRYAVKRGEKRFQSGMSVEAHYPAQSARDNALEKTGSRAFSAAARTFFIKKTLHSTASVIFCLRLRILPKPIIF